MYRERQEVFLPTVRLLQQLVTAHRPTKVRRDLIHPSTALYNIFKICDIYIYICAGLYYLPWDEKQQKTENRFVREAVLFPLLFCRPKKALQVGRFRCVPTHRYDNLRDATYLLSSFVSSRRLFVFYPVIPSATLRHAPHKPHLTVTCMHQCRASRDAMHVRRSRLTSLFPYTHSTKKTP